jgi:nicotinate-nucleotide pyrophosphorylase (carboxylating)
VDDSLRDLVAGALAEDVGSGDVTSEAVVPAGAAARARIVQKEPGVLFGLDAAGEAFSQGGAESFDKLMVEGQWRDGVPAEVALVGGPARALLAAERTALNLLCHLSGVATLTARFVEAVRGTGAQVLDTRKTTPGLRALEKAAVAAGGGRNHRMGLHDAILIKENHAALAGGVGEAVHRARVKHPEGQIEVECRTPAEVEAALDAGADRLLLDNMTPEGLRAAVATRDAVARAHGPVATLEASGGITLDNVAEVAATGVDFISVGALTHSAPALDLSMTLEPVPAREREPAGGQAVESNLETMKRLLDVYDRDPVASADFLDPQVEMYVAPEVGYLDSGLIEGRPAVERWWGRWHTAWDDLETETIELTELGDWVLVENRTRARGKGSGILVERAWSAAYKLRAGRVVRIEFHSDRESALAAARSS